MNLFVPPAIFFISSLESFFGKFFMSIGFLFIKLPFFDKVKGFDLI